MFDAPLIAVCGIGNILLFLSVFDFSVHAPSYFPNLIISVRRKCSQYNSKPLSRNKRSNVIVNIGGGIVLAVLAALTVFTSASAPAASLFFLSLASARIK